MIFSIAPFVETWRVNTQKSAEGILVPGDRDEDPNVEMRKVLHERWRGEEPDRRRRLSGTWWKNTHSTIRLRPDDFLETPRADLHAGCCGEGG
jgi:hypothetical protein